MAGSDSQKQLLTLIRAFASEKSQKERSFSGLRKTIEELRKEYEAASARVENLKRMKETVEQEVKGKEVELAMANASIQTIEKRHAKFEDEISAIGSGIDELKEDPGDEELNLASKRWNQPLTNHCYGY
ncbi:hypothetical protein QQ045_022302 [Rhodiola kirilowii]